jgi:hypothetical protein
VIDQKRYTVAGVPATAEDAPSKRESHLPPLATPATPARVRMVRSVMALAGMTALLVTGCAYAPIRVTQRK